ncbi:MAG: 30S ribosomal protein S20 [Halofilum sp. (in: g-proteobacteria)]|nr:30S ribosomal protein S20 [Halofilum sp. (in: g-proteobacteria)]
MANTPQTRKRAQQNVKRRLHNHSMRSHMRTHVKKVVKALRQRDAAAARAAYDAAVPVVDRMAGKGLIHRNRAARYKSRLNKRIRELAA